VHGEHLLLRRRVEATVGESVLRVHDEVENVGHRLTPHMYMYHVNFGFPVVDDGAEILLAASGVESAREHHGVVDGYETLDPPTDSPEQVYENEVIAEPDGTAVVGIVNRKLNFGAFQTYKPAQVPHHATWRMLGQGTYVVGLEPSTNNMAGRADARANGTLIQLSPGETREYDLELGALDGDQQIRAFEARIMSLKP
jgi:hypothetical protein